MTDCLFCKMIEGKIPVKKRYEDDLVLAFDDIDPKAPVHVLVIPKKHIASVAEMKPEDEPAMGRLYSAAAQIAREAGVARTGYRLVVNSGPDSGQAVFHIHLHLLGGRKFSWPPG